MPESCLVVPRQILSCSNYYHRPRRFIQALRYPPQHLKALTRVLRKAYDGEKEFRGRPDQTTTEYSLSAPIAIAGEVALTEGAMLERIIAVEMSPNQLGI